MSMEALREAVAKKFSDNGKTLRIEILNELYEENVRVYPG